VLGTTRENLGLPDGRLDRPSVAEEAVMRLIEAIRRHRPKVLVTHNPAEYHPDHPATADIVKRAAYKAGLAKLVVPGDPFRPGRIFHFLGDALVAPSFCVDISDHWAKKVKAVLCYKSQFHHAGATRFQGKTDLATPAFLENVEARARFWGIRIKRRHAEAFTCAELPEVDDITALGGERFS
jgi:LmbE family N-acetylglucosaminyl deacetylase